MSDNDNSSKSNFGANDIAIVGMSGRFPGCENIDEFWKALVEGRECIVEYTDEQLVEAGEDPRELLNPNYVRSGGSIEDMEYFDANFFGFSPIDAGILDPQHRHFYECAWEAFENAGHVPNYFEGAIGVFAGCGPNTYFMRHIMTNPDLVRSVGYFLLRHTGNDRDFLPTGVSYKLNLQGPSVAVQTACSTSLVAIHTACQSLLSGECDMALAGGVTISLPHRLGYIYRENEILSPDGHCRPFDANSAGTVITSGVGVVLLRRLEDALADGDHIHAIVKGSAINNDGSRKVGYLAPSVDGHSEVVAEALAVSELTSEDISYIETHGTGTLVGDPIEVEALSEAFRQTTDRRQFCPLGSVKSNIGHTDTAAGIAGLIKVVESLKHKKIPPSLNYEKANPEIDFENSPFFVSDQLRDWESGQKPRRAGISSLGVGGTNAHIIVEEAPPHKSTNQSHDWELLAFSAKTKKALKRMGENLSRFMEENPDSNLSDIAHTLQIGREAFEHRRILSVKCPADAMETLKSEDRSRIFSGTARGEPTSLVFMFPGGGAQYPGMGRELYQTEAVYHQTVDHCLELISPYLDIDISSLMFPVDESDPETARKLQNPTYSTCSIFITSYATAQLWISRGFEPDAMTGHSLGEYVAACIAGVFSLEDALRIVALRGRVMSQTEKAAMLSVVLSSHQVEELLFGKLDLSAINGPELCLVSGPDEEIDQLAAKIDQLDGESRKLNFTAASHCRLLDPIIDQFRAGISEIKLSPPNKKFISNVSGDWAKDEVTDPEYWVRHFRNPVRFHQGLGTILKDQNTILLEVGPGNTLCSLARQQTTKPIATISSLRHPSETTTDKQHFQTAIGRLWIAGRDISWSEFRSDGSVRKIPLPTYPFERQKFWIEPGKIADNFETDQYLEPIHKLENLEEWFFKPDWVERPAQKIEATAESRNILYFGEQKLISSQICERLRARGHRVVEVRIGDRYFKTNSNEFSINPEEGKHAYELLLAELNTEGFSPDQIISDWLLTEGESFRAGSSFFHRNQECGFYSLIFLVQALDDLDLQSPLQIDVVSNGLQAVGDDFVTNPEKATVLGPVRVIPREYPYISVRSIDLNLEKGDDGQSVEPDNPTLDIVENELLNFGCSEILAIRDGNLYSETIVQAELQSKRDAQLKAGGTYLLTGGFGGIGLAISEHLARNYQANLVLISRKKLPERDSWDSWIDTHTEDEPARQIIVKIRQIEELGSAVICESADVANVQEMHKIVSSAKDRFGRIDGVFHAAGYLEDGIIQSKSMESIERVFTPKIHGTRVLLDTIQDSNLDFFVSFGSSSAYLGSSGQVDYVAANSYLNALAYTEKARNSRLLTIDWGVWKDVGAGVTAANRLQGKSDGFEYLHRRIQHPLLGEFLLDRPDKKLIATKLSVETHWILDEHRTGSGTAVLPGTGYIELIRAAFCEFEDCSQIELSDLSFFAPITVDDKGVVEVQLEFVKELEKYSVRIESRSDPSGDWTINATTSITNLQSTGRDLLDISSTKQSCPKTITDYQPQQSDLLKFGPRWDVVDQISYGDDRAVAKLKLDKRFHEDLDWYAAHPAILDIATGYGLSIFAEELYGKVLFVPVSYGEVRIYDRLQKEIISTISPTSSVTEDSEFITFDITLVQPDGLPLIEIKEFTMKRVSNDLDFAEKQPRERTNNTMNRSKGEALFLDSIECGISAQEGLTCLEHALNSDGSHMIISSIDVGSLIAHTNALKEDKTDANVKFDRPDLDSDYEAPRDQLDSELSSIWEDLLGVSQIGINDDFFELGGHSLVAVRLFANIKKQWGIEYPISILFKAPTISSFADMLRDQIGENQDQDTQQPEKAIHSDQFNLIVPMGDVNSETTPPFFLVAGMFGNVLNLRHLAAHLGSDQPVYAIQARGLHGDETPHDSFEDMARDNIEEMKRIQPEGPYYLGGFSGGGLIAYEMAQQLVAAQEEVGVLIMLDSIPAKIPTANLFERLCIQWIRLREGGVNYPLQWAKDRWQWEKQRLSNDEIQLTPAEFRSEEIEKAFRLACDRYQHQTYDGQVDLFCPPPQVRYVLGPDKKLNEHREFLDHANHWEQYIKGTLNVHEVTGDHDSMVLEPHVRVLASKMKACLVKAYAHHDSAVTNEKEKTYIDAAE